MARLAAVGATRMEGTIIRFDSTVFVLCYSTCNWIFDDKPWLN